MPDYSDLISLALDLYGRHRSRREIPVEIQQEHDSIGTSLGVRFMAPMPPGASAVANLESGWGFIVGSRDASLFRAVSGDFYTVGPVVNQVASLYLPYGVLRHRKAGLYSLEIKLVLLKPQSRDGEILATSSTKIALPPPQPWHKVDYLWPFIGLCMTVVRADDEISAQEIRPLKAWLTREFNLERGDMEGLRLAMKAPPVEPAELLAAVRRRMPHLSAADLITLLLRVARLDGPVNPREHATLRRLAALAGLDDQRWSTVVDAHVAE
ncbi:MAG: TerB family tellurite resistance protein [Nannocystaceae bacterium]